MLVTDAAVFVAAADDNDPDHQACADLVETTDQDLVTTGLVLAEAAYLIERQLGPFAEAQFYRSVASGDIHVEPLTASDYERIAELIDKYADLPLGGADASLVAITERFGVVELATLDHRHFRVVRPRHTAALDLLP